MRSRAAVLIAVLGVSTAGCALHEVPTSTAELSTRSQNRHLPDYSEGLVGLLGPFLWARAADLGADARFCDENGRPDTKGRFLWMYQFKRLARDTPASVPLHERNNFSSIDTRIAYEVQPWHVLLNHPRPFNFKLMFGYKQTEKRFEHGDNADLAHVLEADRVIVYVPVRNEGGFTDLSWRRDAHDQRSYHVNTNYANQSVCVMQFRAGEHVSYQWFTSEELDEHILLDLAPYFRGDRVVHPGVTKPVFRFTIDGSGGWELGIERDGRDGLAGGEKDGDWDVKFTHETEGARPYTVDLTSGNSTWAMSTFSPGGTPEETSEIIVGLTPFSRTSGEPVPWPDRSRRVRTFRTRDLRIALDGGCPKPVTGKPRKAKKPDQ